MNEKSLTGSLAVQLSIHSFSKHHSFV